MTARLAVALPLLTLVYALALASFHPLDLATGAVASAAVLLGSRRWLFGALGPPSPGLGRRILWFWPFAAVTAWDVLAGTWQVALVVVGLRPPGRSGIVAVPIGERSERGVAVTALAATLSPGEALVDVDWRRGAMLLQVLGADDPDAVRSHHDRRYRRYQSRVFP